MEFEQQLSENVDIALDVDQDVVIDESSPEEISLARKQGWRPADEFRGSPGEFVNAHEFLERGAQWTHNMKRDLEGLREVTRELVADNARRVAAERQARAQEVEALQREVQELKALKIKAIDNNDGNAVVKIDDQIEAHKEAIADARIAPQASVAPQTDAKIQSTVNDWKSQNPWYVSDARAARYANMAGDEYMVSHPGAQLNDVLAFVEVETKKVFPQYGKTAPAGPDSGGSERSGSRSMVQQQQSGRAGSIKWEGLDEAGRKLGDEMIERGVFKNRAEYLEFYADGDTSTGNVGRTLAKYKKTREIK